MEQKIEFICVTKKQEQFCQEFLIDLNATQALIRSGYNKKTANRIATENLSKPVISKRISELMEERSKRTKIDADQVITELAKIAFASIGDVHQDWHELKDWTELTLAQKAAISEIKVIPTETSAGIINRTMVKMFDKLRALESLAKHVGLYEADKKQKQLPNINFNLVG